MNNLNQAITINQVKLNNRLVMPPMATAKSAEDGKVVEALCEYYDEKSKGGHIGLIILEHSNISQEGKASHGQLSIANDDTIEGLKKLTNIVHKNGSKMIAQLSHAGGRTSVDITQYTPISASASPMLKDKKTGFLPKEMDFLDIKNVIFDFTAAAIRAKKAGFDGIEIHSAHGYLLNQFYSPLTNKRLDAYGYSTIENRIRLHIEIIQAIKKAVGNDFLISLRLGGCDYMEGGSTIEDSVLAAIEFEKVGINLLNISGGFCGFVKPGAHEQGYFSEITASIKKKVSIPVLLTGGIHEASVADLLLEENKADLIGVGRAILNNSNWAKESLSLD